MVNRLNTCMKELHFPLICCLMVHQKSKYMQIKCATYLLEYTSEARHIHDQYINDINLGSRVNIYLSLWWFYLKFHIRQTIFQRCNCSDYHPFFVHSWPLSTNITEIQDSISKVLMWRTSFADIFTIYIFKHWKWLDRYLANCNTDAPYLSCFTFI